MKKLLLLFTALTFSTGAFAESIFSKSVETVKPSNGQVLGVQLFEPKQQNKAKLREDEYLQSSWNFDLDILPFVFPDQLAERQFRTDALSFGVTYKFYKSPFHIFGKYTSLKIKGDKIDGERAEWKHDHYIAGAGIHGFTNNGENQFQVNFGTSIDSKVKDENSDNDIKIKDSFFLELKYLWMWDNISAGIVANILDTVTKDSGYNKGGYKYIGLTAQVGIPGL